MKSEIQFKKEEPVVVTELMKSDKLYAYYDAEGIGKIIGTVVQIPGGESSEKLFVALHVDGFYEHLPTCWFLEKDTHAFLPGASVLATSETDYYEVFDDEIVISN